MLSRRLVSLWGEALLDDPNMEFRQRRRWRPWLETVIWLVEWRKIIVLHVQQALSTIIWRWASNDVKFPNLRFWRQREHPTVNLSFSVFTSSALLNQSLGSVLCKQYGMRARWNNCKTYTFANTFTFCVKFLCCSSCCCFYEQIVPVFVLFLGSEAL